MTWRHNLPRPEGQKQKRSIWIAVLFFAALVSIGTGSHPAHGTSPVGEDEDPPPLTNSEKTALCPWLTDPKLAKDMLKRSNLWNSLYRDSIGNAIPPEWIFARAESDPEYRAALNKKIETDSGISPGLKRLMRLGKSQADFLAKIQDPNRDLNPGKTIQQEWEEFRKSMIETTPRPMPPHEAENLARVQISQRLRIPIHRVDQHLKNHPQDRIQYNRTAWRLSQTETPQRTLPDDALKKARAFIQEQIRTEEKKFTRIFTELLQGMMAHNGESLWLSKDQFAKGVWDSTAIQIKKLKSVDWVTQDEANREAKKNRSWFPTIVAVQKAFKLGLLRKSRTDVYKSGRSDFHWLSSSRLDHSNTGTVLVNNYYQVPSISKIFLRLHTERGTPTIVPLRIDDLLLLSVWADKRVDTYEPKQSAVSQQARIRLLALAESLHVRDWLHNVLSSDSYRTIDNHLRAGVTVVGANTVIAEELELAAEVALKERSPTNSDATDHLNLAGQLGGSTRWERRTNASQYAVKIKEDAESLKHFLNRHPNTSIAAVLGPILLTIYGVGKLIYGGSDSDSGPAPISQEYSAPKEHDPDEDKAQHPTSRAWITENVWLPTAADSQAWNAKAPGAFLAEYGDPQDASEERVELVDITEQVLSEKHEPIQKLSQLHPKETSVTFSNYRAIAPIEGWVSLPRPHNTNELTHIHGDPIKYERVVEDRKTGNVFLKFKGEVNKVGLPDTDWRVNDQKKKQQDYDAKKILDDERLKNLNPEKVLRVADEMDEAGLTSLSQSISGWVASSKGAAKPLTVPEFVDLISSAPHYYSLAPGGSDFFAAFSFNDFRKFLRFQKGDSLLLKCDYANELLQLSLKKIFEDYEDIKILPSESKVFIADPRDSHRPDHEELVDGYGVTYTYTENRAGHARTIIQIEGKPGAIWLDGTPTRRRRGEEYGINPLADGAPAKKAASKKYPKRRKTKPAQMRAQAYIREDQPLQTLEDHAPDLRSEVEVQTESVPTPDLQVNMAEQRQLAAQRIRALADKIVELPSLQAISGLNPAPLPLATYRLALKLAAVLEGTGDPKDFMAALFEAYPFELQNAPIPKSNQGLVRLWERAVAIEEKRLNELKRISLESKTARYDLAWTLDKTLLDFSRQLLQLSLDGMRPLNPLEP